MYIYLNKKIMFNDELMGVELIVFENLANIKYQIVHSNNIKSFIDEFKNKADLDFDLDDENNLITNHEVKKVVIPNLSFLPKETITKRECVSSLYDLLDGLAENKCLFIDDLNKINNCEEYKGYFPLFSSIRVSQSTMGVLISVKDENGDWASKKLIYMNEDKMLKQNSFYCAVPLNLKLRIVEDNLVKLFSVKINNVDYDIYSYNCNLPICSSTSSFILPEPLIVHYGYLGYVYKSVTLCLKKLINKYVVIEDTSKEQDKPKRLSRTDRTGIHFEVMEKNLSNADAESIVNNCLTIMGSAKNLNMGIDDDLINDVMSNINPDNDMMIDVCYRTIFRILMTGQKVNLDILENAKNLLDAYKMNLLKIQLFLYNIRVSCYYNPRLLGVEPYVSSFIIQGSVFNKALRISII